EEMDGLGAGKIDAAPFDLAAELPEARIAGKQQRLQPGRIAVARGAEQAGIGAAAPVERHQLAGLSAFDIGDRHPVAGLDLDQQRTAACDGVTFGAGRQGKAARHDDCARSRRTGDHIRIAKVEHRHFPAGIGRLASAEDYFNSKNIEGPAAEQGIAVPLSTQAWMTVRPTAAMTRWHLNLLHRACRTRIRPMQRENGMYHHKITDWDDAYTNGANIAGGDRWPDAWLGPSKTFRAASLAVGRAKLDLAYGDIGTAAG